MTDKIQKIRKEVERLKLCTMDEHMKFYSECAEAEYNALCKVEEIVDSMQEETKTSWIQELQERLDTLSKEDFEKVWAKYKLREEESWNERLGEEPASDYLETEIDKYSKDNYTDEDRKILCDGCEEECKYSKSDDFTKALAECIHQAQGRVVDPLVLAETWKDELIKLAKSEDLVSKDLEEASKEWLRPQLDKSYANYGEKKMMELTHFDGYAMLDAIEFGAKLQKQQLMAKAFDFTKEHDTACVLASECLRNHGWFNRERDFNDLWRHLSCVDELFVGKFSGKTKVIVIKED